MSLIRSVRFYKGIRSKITFVYSLLFGLFLCTYAYIISYQYLQSGRDDFDSGLFNYAIDLSDHLSVDKSNLKINFNVPASEIKKAFPFILNQTFYSVRSYDGKILVKSKESFPVEEIPYNHKLVQKENYTHRFFSFKNEDKNYRAVNLKMTNLDQRELILQVAASSDSLDRRESNHLIVSIFMVPILIIISSFISYLIAGSALAPIKSLTDSANQIAAQNLSLRVPEADTADEVEELSKTLNHLLSRLETSFEAQKNFVANASHQLNTPLAIMKGELDVLESKPRSPEEHQLYFTSLREELERMIDLVKNMLLISRVESGLEQFSFLPCRLDDLLLTIISRLSFKAREKRITVKFNIDESVDFFEVMGEKQLLDSLFENILDNAIKYTPIETMVKLDLKRSGENLLVSIQDEGPGIEEEEFLRITHSRYQRGTVNVPGNGIGLDIAFKIAKFHGAEIKYKKIQPTGSHFEVLFFGLKKS